MESEAICVKEFTEQASGRECPSRPVPMNKEEVSFIIKMCKSELWELAMTVCDTPEEAMEMVTCKLIDINPAYKKPQSELSIIAEQADAFVDINYYCLNAAAKKGINLRPIFVEVHQANMNKKFPDGEFHRRDDGKIIKPDNWREPDIEGVIQKQMISGSWN